MKKELSKCKWFYEKKRMFCKVTDSLQKMHFLKVTVFFMFWKVIDSLKKSHLWKLTGSLFKYFLKITDFLKKAFFEKYLIIWKIKHFWKVSYSLALGLALLHAGFPPSRWNIISKNSASVSTIVAMARRKTRERYQSSHLSLCLKACNHIFQNCPMILLRC